MTTDEKPEFHIDSIGAADWLLQKYFAIDAEIALLKAQAEAAVKRLQSDREGLERLYQSELESFIRSLIAQDKKGRKSLILPHGTCAVRAVPGGLRITDENAALKYARSCAKDAIRTEERLDSAKYRELAEKALQSEGEMLPGIDMQPDRESFTVKFGKPDA